MQRVTIDELIWDTWNREHIKKHAISPKEVEEAVNRAATYKEAHSGRLMVIGRSGGRILSVVLAKEKAHRYYVITARDADKKERKLVYEQENK